MEKKTMNWQEQISGDPLSWLTAHDDAGVRYLALRDLLDLQASDPQLAAAREAAHKDRKSVV